MSSNRSKVIFVFIQISPIFKEHAFIYLFIFDIGLSNIYFFRYTTSGRGNKCKNKQIGLHQNKKLLCNKRNYQQNEIGCLLNRRGYLQMIFLFFFFFFNCNFFNFILFLNFT